jgi:hypothetical protein
MGDNQIKAKIVISKHRLQRSDMVMKLKDRVAIVTGGAEQPHLSGPI